MRTRIRLAALTAGAAVLAAGGMMPTSASATTPASSTRNHLFAFSGIAYLPANVDLQPTASGTWVNTGLQVTLPSAGTYALDLDVRARLQGVPPVNTYMVARLWNVASGAALPNSERILSQLIDTTSAGAGIIAKNTTSPISERITVTGPTTIRLQAQRTNAFGASTIAAIWSDSAGRTSFRFGRIF
ncbi:hypothetical protein AB0H88_50830 [Nonomuraea sp. NPDC050680]|uniref:hypothetical protein n=1 Tax=Nonomuraea sp. NPDC050680 TaxID=3154630 RepID=UPI0033F298FE